MQVTDEMIEKAAEAFSKATAWYPDNDVYGAVTEWFRLDAQDAVDFGVLKEPKWDGISDIRGMQHEWYVAAVVKEPMRAALTAALSDKQAVESVAGYRRRLPQYTFEHYEFEQPGYESPSISDWEPLYTSPPLSREGEDSAEVERLRGLLSRAEEYVIDGVTNAKAEAEMNAPYPARAHRYDAALAEVRQLYADIQAALAATRSGSATTAKGCDHG